MALWLLSACAPQQARGVRSNAQASVRASPLVRLHPLGVEREGRDPLHLEVELARTRGERRRGLMFRRGLPEGRGMLFVYPDEIPRHFWMRNMFIPLDMIFVSSELRIVGIVRDVPPDSEALWSVDAPARYVLEVAAGVAEREGLREGDRLLLPPSLDSGSGAAGPGDPEIRVEEEN